MWIVNQQIFIGHTLGPRLWLLLWRCIKYVFWRVYNMAGQPMWCTWFLLSRVSESFAATALTLLTKCLLPLWDDQGQSLCHSVPSPSFQHSAGTELTLRRNGLNGWGMVYVDTSPQGTAPHTVHAGSGEVRPSSWRFATMITDMLLPSPSYSMLSQPVRKAVGSWLSQECSERGNTLLYNLLSKLAIFNPHSVLPTRNWAEMLITQSYFSDWKTHPNSIVRAGNALVKKPSVPHIFRYSQCLTELGPCLWGRRFGLPKGLRMPFLCSYCVQDTMPHGLSHVSHTIIASLWESCSTLSFSFCRWENILDNLTSR